LRRRPASALAVPDPCDDSSHAVTQEKSDARSRVQSHLHGPTRSAVRATLTTSVPRSCRSRRPPRDRPARRTDQLFAAGAFGGVQRTPYAWLFKRLVRPRLAPPAELEDAAPPRFAQTVGLLFALVALTGFLTGATALGLVAAVVALAAAFLNAAFGFCLGCEIYLLVRRRPAALSTTRHHCPTTGAGPSPPPRR
jgi:hypothetical protein